MKEFTRFALLGTVITGTMIVAYIFDDKGQSQPSSLTPEEISWIEFCKVNGYDSHTDNDEIINEFLDSWRGSSEEEAALSQNEKNA